MVSQHETDVAALHSLDELKTLKKELHQTSVGLAKLVGALRDPVHWRIKAEAPLGYGEQSAQDVQLPDLKALGEKVFEYQKKHYDLTMQVSRLSPSVRKTVEGELDRL